MAGYERVSTRSVGIWGSRGFSAERLLPLSFDGLCMSLPCHVSKDGFQRYSKSRYYVFDIKNMLFFFVLSIYFSCPCMHTSREEAFVEVHYWLWFGLELAQASRSSMMFFLYLFVWRSVAVCCRFRSTSSQRFGMTWTEMALAQRPLAQGNLPKTQVIQWFNEI